MHVASKRRTLLDEIAAWHSEGIVDDDFVRTMEARYASLPDTEDAAATPTGSGTPTDAADRANFASNTLQLVGGILLGAGLVALGFFLDMKEDVFSWFLFLVGLTVVAGGVLLRYTDTRRVGLEEALLVAGLIPLTFAPWPANVQLIGVLSALVAAGVYLERRGHGPVVVFAGIAYVLTTLAAFGPELFGDPEQRTPVFLWQGVLLAFFAALLTFRHEKWTSVGLGLYVAPLVVSFILILGSYNVTSLGNYLGVGLYLGGLLAVGIQLNDRGLVAGSAGGLTIDAVAFAADLGGPGPAVVLLLVLGGLLVWQAELVRSYFRRA